MGSFRKYLVLDLVWPCWYFVWSLQSFQKRYPRHGADGREKNAQFILCKCYQGCVKVAETGAWPLENVRRGISLASFILPSSFCTPPYRGVTSSSPRNHSKCCKSGWYSGVSLSSLLQRKKLRERLLPCPGFAPAQAKGWARGRGAEERAKETPNGETVKKKKRQEENIQQYFFLCIMFYLSLLMMFCGWSLWFLFFSLFS